MSWFNIIKSEEFLNRLADIIRQRIPNVDVKVEPHEATKAVNIGQGRYKRTKEVGVFLALSAFFVDRRRVGISIQEIEEDKYVCIFSLNGEYVSVENNVTETIAERWLTIVLNTVA